MKKSKAMSYAVAALLLSSVALAQTAPGALTISTTSDALTTQGVSMMSTVASWLTYFGIGTCTLAVLFQGYKVMFKSHRWGDVGHVLGGAIMIGGAATIAGLVFKLF